MAKIKGWRKVYDRNFHFAYTDKNESTGIVGYKSTKYDVWFVEIRKQDVGADFQGEFKNKNDAMKWSVKYMELHPNG